jgi:cilia- and flagella-associated protein 52
MIVWDIESGKALYGTPNRDPVNQIKFFNKSDDKIIAVQTNGVSIFSIDKVNKKVRPTF